MANPNRNNNTTSSAEWMMHPSIVFKAFDEQMMKAPFPQYSSHIIPEKIIDCYIDQSNIRCYRVKWVDNWLTEQHVLAAFPSLITEFWMNKPMEPLYQSIENNAARNLSELQMTNQPEVSTVKNDAKQVTTDVTTNQMETVTSDSQNVITLQQVAAFENENEKCVNEAETSVAETPNTIPTNANPTITSTPNANTPNTIQEKDIAPEFAVNDNLHVSPQKEAFEQEGNVGEGQDITRDSSNVENQEITNVEQNNAEQNPAEVNEDKELEKSDADAQREKLKSNMELTFSKLQNDLTSSDSTSIEQQIAVTQNAAFQYFQFEQMQQLNQQITNQIQQIPVVKPTKKSKKAKEKQPVVCDICGKVISSKKNLRMHKVVKHFKNGSFACEICDRKFALKRDLQRHMPLHTNERKYVCKFCGMQCKQPGHLTKHLRTHTEVMNWRCDCCFKTFRVQADLKHHCFTEHKDISENNLDCSVCKEKLKLPNSVYRHSLRHSGVRDFKCTICQATFKLKQHMQSHMRTHEKPETPEKFTCKICSKEFRSKAICEKHEKKHVELTAEEYQEKERLKKEKKEKSKGAKPAGGRKKKILSDAFGDGAKGTKRKQNAPLKVQSNAEDAAGELAKKFLPKDEFRCPYCPEIFSVKALLNTHIKLHENKLMQFSEICGENLEKLKSDAMKTSGLSHIVSANNSAVVHMSNNMQQSSGLSEMGHHRLHNVVVSSPYKDIAENKRGNIHHPKENELKQNIDIQGGIINLPGNLPISFSVDSATKYAIVNIPHNNEH